jgi:dienelactone hydrolase
VFGISGHLPNNLLLADSFAARGLAVYMPDILNNDAVPASAMNDPTLDLDAWFARHGPETTRPAIEKVVAALRAQGVTRIAAVAYCESPDPLKLLSYC